MAGRSVFPALMLGGLIGLMGCEKNPAGLDVKGSVKYDDQPVSEGTIRFNSTDPARSAGEGFIKDGRYTVKLGEGSYSVEIRSPKPKAPPKVKQEGPGGEGVVESIPEKYNRKTELKVDVGPGKLDHDFNLKK